MATVLSPARGEVTAVAGPAVGLDHTAHDRYRPTRRVTGAWFAVLAALGQAGGAVISRKAYAAAAAAGHPFMGSLPESISAAFQRMLGRIGIPVGFLLLTKILGLPIHSRKPFSVPGLRWLLAHAVAGPVAGVTLFQWSLMLQPANVVLPIVATTPLVVLPLTRWLENEPVTSRTLLGSALAVGGVVLLVLVA